MRFFWMFVMCGVAACGTEVKGSGNDAGRDAAPAVEDCRDELQQDEDGDGLANCEDPDCADRVYCQPDAGEPDAGDEDAGPALPECDDNMDCDDADACNGLERCIAGNCLPALASPEPCNDEVACTADSCDSRTGDCIFEPVNRLCHGDEPVCDVVNGCVCESDASCNDLDPCNGAEVCVEGSCIGTDEDPCDDLDLCTFDECVPDGDGVSCLYTLFARPECALPLCDDDEVHRCSVCGHRGFSSCEGGDFGSCSDDEECNACDDDLDGLADEDFACVRGSDNSCMTECGSEGSARCNAACELEECRPPTEACNGEDDDCDGNPDNGFACAIGQSRACTTECGSTGIQSCSDSCSWGPCVPPIEACNGLDDDCRDGRDNAFACVQSSAEFCISRCGTEGMRTCSASCAWGSCQPFGEICGDGLDNDCDPLTPDSCPRGPVEVCDGGDNDGDGAADEDFECRNGRTRPCLTGCGSVGVERCEECSWSGSCIPPLEISAEDCGNGRDDDCDGNIDAADLDCPQPPCEPQPVDPPLNPNSGFEMGLASWQVERSGISPPRQCSCVAPGPLGPDGSQTVRCTVDANNYSDCQLKFVFAPGVIASGDPLDVFYEIRSTRATPFVVQLMANDGGPYDSVSSNGGLNEHHTPPANTWVQGRFAFTASDRITAASQPRLTLHMGALYGSVEVNFFALRRRAGCP